MDEGESSKSLPPQLFCCLGLLMFIPFFIGLLSCTFTSGCDASALENAATDDSTTATVPEATLQRIKDNKAVYQAAATTTGLSWQMLAALHFREGSNDPDHSGPSGEAPGTVSPDTGTIRCYTFQECEEVQARALISLASGVYGVSLTADSSSDDIKKAFLAYNRGNMYKNGGCAVETSPYVMNNFSESFYHMIFPNSTCEPASTRGRTDTRNGAYTLYVYLINEGI